MAPSSNFFDVNIQNNEVLKKFEVQNANFGKC